MTESPREKVAICIPYYRTVEGPTLLSAMEMCLYSGRYIDALPLAVSSAYVEQNRNGLVKLAFQMGIEFDYLLWMDSVTADTPILVRREGEPWIDLIEACEFIPPSERFLRGRTYSHTPYEVMTHQGWQKPSAAMQHQIRKPVARVTDEAGTVCVTEDHSLISNGEAVSSKHLKEGMKLDHIDPSAIRIANELPPVTEDYAEVLGFFAAEGSCGPMGNGYFWSLSNTDRQRLARYALVLESVHAREFMFVQDGASLWKLLGSRPRDLTHRYRAMFYTATGKKRVPKEILNAPLSTVRAFLRGYEAGDGHDRRGGLQNPVTNSMCLAAGIKFLYARLGRDLGINPQRADKPEIVHLYERRHGTDQLKSPPGVRHVQRDEEFSGWVYDLSTPAGTFVGGVGLFVLHNTDMIFPADALLRLMSHEKDIVGVNYRQRTPPYTYVGHYLAENGEASLDMANILKPGLQPMFQMPTGLLLTRFDIYRKMKWPWFDASVTGPRDDIYFCRKARSMGYEIWCDQELTAKVRHRDMQEIPWFNPEQLQIHRGAGLMKDTGEAESAAVAKKMKPHFEKLNDQSAA